MNEELLTVADVAQKLKVSRGWVHDHIKRRNPRLNAIKLGSVVRVTQSDLAEFIDHCKQVSIRK